MNSQDEVWQNAPVLTTDPKDVPLDLTFTIPKCLNYRNKGKDRNKHINIL